jgi:hypothetical protein
MKTVRFALVMMMFFFSGILLSKETKHQINGIVMDALTYERLPYSKVELLRTDSTFISATITPKDTVDSENTGLFVFNVMEKGSYLLRVAHSGYETKYQKFSLVNNRQGAILLGRIKLTKINNILKEITVTGTKIKMLLHGDTIIYNADAFNMANGSMLDALISRFPGVKLDKNGNISINGEFVESLLINGLDFSSSSPKLALENLPAYTVDKVKVFKKESNLSKMMGKDMGNNHFVMDVRLKKEYSVGWLCNAEAGIGTKNRYTGKAICMRFSPKSRFILFENINNLNDKRRVGSDAEWEPNDMSSGLMSSKTTGLYYMISTPDQSAWLASYNTFTHEDGDDKTWTSNQTYLSGGDSYSKSTNHTNYRSTSMVSENQYNIYSKKFFIGGNLKLNYGKNKTENSYYSAIFNSDPSAYFNILDSLFSNTYGYYKDITLNKIRKQSESNLNKYSFSTDFESGIRTTVDLIRFNGSMSYQYTRDNTFSLYDLTYLKNGGTNDYRNYYKHHPSQDFSTQFETSYDYCITNGTICPFYKFSNHYNHTEDMLYRLDKLSNRDSIRYDLLPSTTDALNDVLDNPNSSYFTEHDNYHSVGLGIHHNNVFGKSGYGYISITLPLRWINNSIRYHRMNNYNLSKNKLFFEPSLFMDYKKNTSTSYVYANIELKFTSKIPDMVNFIDYRDESDPLNIRLGNSNLKNTHIMSLSTTFTKNINKHQTAISFNAKFNQINHAVAYGFVFDKTNGVTTTKPVNVDGNWIVNANMGYTRTIDSDNHITIDNKFGTDYNHCVDMSRISGENESVKSIVRNLSLNDILKFDYRLNDKLQFGINAKGQYSHVTSARKGFTIINAGDFSYGFSTIIELPWHLQFSTDINDFCHRGYSDKAMNTNELIWNTRLTKNLLKGKLMISLDGFDLLGNLSNRQYVLNSQGRTENYTNVIPRYAMLRVSYRFNKNPQNSQK